MPNPPPGSLAAVAEEISTGSTASPSSSSSSRYSRSTVSTSEAECHQRCFATASGAFFLAFSGGLAVQVELARRLPSRLRGFTSFIPAFSAILASVESYRFLSTRCSTNHRRSARSSGEGVGFGSRSSTSTATTAAKRRSSASSSENSNASGNFGPGLLARRVVDRLKTTTTPSESLTNNSTECCAAASAASSSSVDTVIPTSTTNERESQQLQQLQHQAAVVSRPQIPVWNHIAETPTATQNHSDNSFAMIPGLP